MFVCFARLTKTTEKEKYGPKPFVGIYFARDIADLFQMIDEQVSPVDCEYAVIKKPFGLHVDMVVDKDDESSFSNESTYFSESLYTLMSQAMTSQNLTWVSFDTLQQPVSEPGHA